MLKHNLRSFHAHHVRQISLKDVKRIIVSSKQEIKRPRASGSIISNRVVTTQQAQIIENKKSLPPNHGKKYMSWINLSSKLNTNYTEPTVSEKNLVSYLFNSVATTYEWSVGRFEQIPSEQLKIARSELHSDRVRAHNLSIERRLLRPLPEIAFLGRTNTGKSTLINALITKAKQKDLSVYAKMSKTAGFTKTLNCFNVGNYFRVIDTPGYGARSTSNQGSLTMDYLSKRQELVRTFVLLSAERKIHEVDAELITFLTEKGLPFEIVFTQIDKVANPESFYNMVEKSILLKLPTLPRIIITNSKTSKNCYKRFGIDYLRFVIAQSCNLTVKNHSF